MHGLVRAAFRVTDERFRISLNQQFSFRGKLQGLGGKCLDVPFTADSDDNAGNGKQLQTWDCIANQANQVLTYTW